MSEFLIYQAKVAITISAFYMFYRLLLSRETLHRLNRAVLICTAALSFILPFCIITVTKTIIMNGPSMTLAENTIETGAEAAGTPWWQTALFALFVTGAASTLTYTAISVAKVGTIIRKGQKRLLETGETLVLTDMNIVPFSWMKYIVVSKEDYGSDAAYETEGLREIITHERAHIALRHSWDILFTDLMTSMQWFNPAMWMLKADLRAIHEFQADDTVLRSGVNIRQYQYLLIRKAVGKSGYSVANSFNHSTLKQRITMMSNKKSSSMRAWKALYIIPLVGISLAATAHTKVLVSYGTQSNQAIEAPDSLNGKVIKISRSGQQADSLSGTIISITRTALSDKDKAIYVIDGKKSGKDALDAIAPSSIRNVDIHNDAETLAKYGADAKNGSVIFVTTKDGSTNSADDSAWKVSIVATGNEAAMTSVLTSNDKSANSNIVYVLNDKVVEDLKSVGNTSTLKVTVHNDEETLKKYGAQDKDAVVFITTK